LSLLLNIILGLLKCGGLSPIGWINGLSLCSSMGEAFGIQKNTLTLSFNSILAQLTGIMGVRAY